MSCAELTDGRTLTYGEAVFEATRSEMARDPQRVRDGPGRRRRARHVRHHARPAQGVRRRAQLRHAAVGGRDDRRRHRRGADGHAADPGPSAHGLRAAVHEPARQHRGEDAATCSAARVKVPMVVRAVIGRSWGQGAQHSQALPLLFHAHSRPAGRGADHAARRQGLPDPGDPRRQSGDLRSSTACCTNRRAWCRRRATRFPSARRAC